jgi:hypothetical protein
MGTPTTLSQDETNMGGGRRAAGLLLAWRMPATAPRTFQVLLQRTLASVAAAHDPLRAFNEIDSAAIRKVDPRVVGKAKSVFDNPGMRVELNVISQGEEASLVDELVRLRDAIGFRHSGVHTLMTQVGCSGAGRITSPLSRRTMAMLTCLLSVWNVTGHGRRAGATRAGCSHAGYRSARA